MAFIKPLISIQKKKAESLSFYIVIPKKEIKNAADRNKMKRRIRTIFQIIPQKPYSLKIFVTKQALYLPYSQIQAIIQAQYDY
jgi:ribonuclease P protein component